MSALPVKSKVWNEAVRVETELLLRTIKITDADRFEADILEMKNGRGMYERISAKVNGVPWWVIGCIHSLECSYNFEEHLHNGDSLKRRTVREPAGRPVKGAPPFDFDESAIDALTMPGKEFHKVTDWSLPRVLWLLEGFNGYGYRLYRKIFSPYLWAGTNHYTAGKYVRDGVYSAKAVSAQSGVAGLIYLLKKEGLIE